MYAANALLWADREPAVNVYKEGGEFLPHKDGQALTVLIPLTTSDAFKGGVPDFGARTQTPCNLVGRRRYRSRLLQALLYFGGGG